MLVSPPPRRALHKAEKEAANRLIKHETDNLKDDTREKASDEKPLSANPKSSGHSCSLNPLQLHLLISVTMILLTHRYPQVVLLI